MIRKVVCRIIRWTVKGSRYKAYNIIMQARKTTARATVED